LEISVSPLILIIDFATLSVRGIIRNPRPAAIIKE
jgi:hypothetical protein